jgi:hypothetical protein
MGGVIRILSSRGYIGKRRITSAANSIAMVAVKETVEERRLSSSSCPWNAPRSRETTTIRRLLRASRFADLVSVDVRARRRHNPGLADSATAIHVVAVRKYRYLNGTWAHGATINVARLLCNLQIYRPDLRNERCNCSLEANQHPDL